MKKRRRAIAIIIGLVLCLSLLASCKSDDGKTTGPPPATASNTPASTPSASGGTPSQPSSVVDSPPPPPSPDEGVRFAEELTIIMDNLAIPVIDPFAAMMGGPATNWTFNMVYNRLVTYEGPGQYGPNLALSWESDDGLTWTFHLRDNVYFHNGEKFTANDVRYTILRAQEAVGTSVAARWAAVVDINVVDPLTVQLTLGVIDADFFYNLAQSTSVIVNEKAMNEDLDHGMWIGTGAWIISEFATNDYVRLVRNDNFWGEPAVTQRITLKYIPEQATKLMMLQNGEADACFSLDPVDLPLVEADTNNFVCYTATFNNTQGIAFNMDDPICGNYNFRMAVMSAIDRSEITMAALGAYGIPETTGSFGGYAQEYRDLTIPIVPYDLDAARAYLADSPYNGETIEIATAIDTLIISAQVVQQQLSRIGIDITINVMDPPALGAYCRYGENRSQMCVAVIPVTIGAKAYRDIYYPGASFNRASYNNPEVADLLDRARESMDANERRALFTEMQQIIAQDPPYVNMFYMAQVIACVRGVGGMILASDSPSIDLTYIYRLLD